MKATKIIFLCYPGRVVVCESSSTPGSTDPETGDLREYARIIPRTSELGMVYDNELDTWLTQFEFAGAIEYTKHSIMLTDEQRIEIEQCSVEYAAKDAEKTAWAKNFMEWQRNKYTNRTAN